MPRTALLALSLIASTPLFAAPDAVDGASTQWILARLARPAPMRTAFVELRDSPLLKAPLRIEGEYRRPTDDTLVREVRSPYPETTTIRSGTVSIARAGKSPRSFSLSRVPELAGLQASFGALLSGDRQLLDQHYRVASSGSHQHWTLTLTPKDAAFAAKVRDITLYGRGAELRCIETTPAGKGEVQRTLLAGAAHAAATAATATELATLCHQDSAHQ
ncbi:LolA-related protein [Cognatiluteimonas profundi]|uniref:LolA-related protein n=1 Tax=Cognatiluteimonas profundi TaxID=2594501 RepID=UPI003CCD4E87